MSEPRWIPFLDRLAETRTVIVPSLPGYPGATGHSVLDNHLDWIVAVRQLLDKAGQEIAKAKAVSRTDPRVRSAEARRASRCR